LKAVVVLAPEPIRPRMAGMGIRALELARSLSSAGFGARLLVPNDVGEAREAAGGVEVEAAVPGRLAAAAGGADAGVVSGHAANTWFHEIPDLPCAVDLYDPFPIENLHYAKELGEATARHDHATLALSLSRGDYFLCASGEQRLFYAGALFAAGRIGASNFPEDPRLLRLLAVVPFGVPAEAAAGDGEAGRRAVGATGPGPLVLFGGVYDWYDPELLLEAWPAVLRREAAARLLFFENPNPATTPQVVFRRARERAGAIDPAGRSVIFSPWLPYARRADLYAGCDLLVSICSDGLETELSYRTRLLDAAWGGVPSVAVGGGSLARELAGAGAAIECARDAGALAAAIEALLADGPRLASMSDAARAFARGRAWTRVAEPLAAWVREARVDPGRRPLPAPAPGRSRFFKLFK
jgi:glycosyltransferase involved in cell wall biosynthesis